MSQSGQAAIRAALAISALSSQERQWLLGQLDPAQKKCLSRAMADMASVETPTLLDVFMPGDAGDPALQALYPLVPQLVNVIETEPTWMWPSIGAALGSHLRQQILQFIQDTRNGDALRRAWQSPAPLAPKRDLVLRQYLHAEAERRPAVIREHSSRAPKKSCLQRILGVGRG